MSNSNLDIFERNMLLSFAGNEEAELIYLRGKDISEPLAYKVAMQWVNGTGALLNTLKPVLQEMYGGDHGAIKFIADRQYHMSFPNNSNAKRKAL